LIESVRSESVRSESVLIESVLSGPQLASHGDGRRRRAVDPNPARISCHD